jgi:molecular chaperone DnaK
MNRPLHLGIDLGTTNSTACVFDGSQVHLVRNAQGGSLTPSVVRLDARGNILVGSKARKLFESDPDNVRGEFKRLMGSGQTIAFPRAKRELLPEQLSAEVLKSLRADVQEQFGFAPARAVISVPALFELPQNAATSEAARLAGFERVELIQEPIASALAAGWTAESDTGSWLVYDLGGGTFDVSLLETRDGLLRVVGHDGDNFLGGRDLDLALGDWLLGELLRTTGHKIERSERAHALGLRRLKAAVEDAKIELSRAQTASVLVPAAFTVDGDSVDVDLTLERGQLETLCLPLVDRSIAVCQRLLTAHGLEPHQLSRLVLVGGPTVMPFLRARLAAILGVPFAEGLDPMTLVAQGAALYAATSGLDARAPSAAPEPGRKLWLQYPAMTSDIAPHVVGRLLDEGAAEAAVATVQLVREDGGFETAPAALSAEGAFVLAVDVLPRRPNDFRVVARNPAGGEVRVTPSRFTIVQGVTLSDPPLSRSVGVATADDDVHVYFERGAPLPARRNFRHHTVEAIIKGDKQSVLRIPMVQGEFERAHLCRVVGALEIRGDQLRSTLPVDTELDLTLELDRGGRLSASALVPATQQVFQQVAQLLVPDVTPAALRTMLGATNARLGEVHAAAFRHGLAKSVERLARADTALASLERDLEAAEGGDADAAQKAKRSLLEIDALLEECELEAKWPELDDEAQRAVANASRWVAAFGTPPEQRLLEEASLAVERARKARQVVELQRRVQQVRQLMTAAYYRDPDSWQREFDHAASDIMRASDVPRAERLVAEGRRARGRNDLEALKSATRQLWQLLPASDANRRAGHGSSLR